MSIEQQTRALLALVEEDRSRRCAALLGEARDRAAALLRQAHADAGLRSCSLGAQAGIRTEYKL